MSVQALIKLSSFSDDVNTNTVLIYRLVEYVLNTLYLPLNGVDTFCAYKTLTACFWACL